MRSAPSYHGENKWIMPLTDIGRYGTDANGNPIQSEEFDNPWKLNSTPGLGDDIDGSATKHSTSSKLKIAHGILTYN